MSGLTIPTGTYPTSTSTSSGTSGSSYSNQSNSAANSFSGLPTQYGTSILSNTVPMLNQMTSQMPQNIEDWQTGTYNAYADLMKNSYQNVLPSVLNDLASRNIINSSVAGDAIANAANQINQSIGSSALQNQANTSQMLANMPSVLAQIAGLGQQSTSQSNSSSTGGGSSSSTNSSSSYTEDPLAPYELLYGLIGQMA